MWVCLRHFRTFIWKYLRWSRVLVKLQLCFSCNFTLPNHRFFLTGRTYWCRLSFPFYRGIRSDVFFKILVQIYSEALVPESFDLKELQETPSEAFSCKLCEIFHSIFVEHLYGDRFCSLLYNLDSRLLKLLHAAVRTILS